MTSSNKYISLFIALTIFIVSLKSCSCRNLTGWPTAGITWYGDPNGAGSTGGACGYGDAVATLPFNGMISAGGPSIFRDGKGCGACYKIVCTENPACSSKPVKVVITDECPGCTSEPVHFDLSGKSFGGLAKPGQEDQLRNAGVLRVKYKRARCVYPNTNIAFHMDPGANPYYMSFAVKFVNGDGNFASVEIQPAGNGNYIKMEEMRSAVWKLNSGSPLYGPFNIRLTSGVSGKVVVAENIIPENWSPNAVYRSTVNF